MKKYIVRLSREERSTLKKLLTSGRGSGRMFTRVRILLKADQSDEGPAWPDEKISESFDVTVQTIERHPYTQKCSRKKIDGDVEAHLIALCCSDPPKGRVRWTLRLLADKVVELGYVDSISYEAVRQTLKKTNLSLG
jgi:hypothetical protein